MILERHFFCGGAAFGEIWIASRSAKCGNSQYKMRCGGGKSNLGERAGSVLQFHVRIMVESDCKLPFNRFRQISLRFWTPSVAGAVFGDVGG